MFFWISLSKTTKGCELRRRPWNKTYPLPPNLAGIFCLLVFVFPQGRSCLYRYCLHQYLCFILNIEHIEVLLLASLNLLFVFFPSRLFFSVLVTPSARLYSPLTFSSVVTHTQNFNHSGRCRLEVIYRWGKVSAIIPNSGDQLQDMSFRQIHKYPDYRTLLSSGFIKQVVLSCSCLQPQRQTWEGVVNVHSSQRGVLFFASNLSRTLTSSTSAFQVVAVYS